MEKLPILLISTVTIFVTINGKAIEGIAKTNDEVAALNETVDLQLIEEVLLQVFNDTASTRSADLIQCKAVYPEERISCDVSSYPKYGNMILNNAQFCHKLGCCFDPTFPVETGYPKCFQKAAPNVAAAEQMRRSRQCAAIPEYSRDSCGWYRGMTDRECRQRGCCWANPVRSNSPICYKFDPTIKVNQPIMDSYPLPSYEVTEDVAPRPQSQPYVVESCQEVDFNTPCGTSDVSFRNCKEQGCCWVESNSYNIKCFNSSLVVRSETTEDTTPSVPSTAAIPQFHPMPTSVYDRVTDVRQQKPQPGNQKSSPDLSSLAEIMIFCGKDSGALCAMTFMNRMGGNKAASSITPPTATKYMNYMLKRSPYTPSPSGAAMHPKTDARTTLIAAPTGDPILDEKCYNTTQFKMFASFHAPCGGFLKPRRILTESQCIDIGCCWVDSYQSILRKALLTKGMNPTLLHHLYPMFGINIPGGVNCIEALSSHQIAKIGQMAALNSYSEDAEHSAMNSPQLLNMFLDQDDPVSTLMSTMMMISGNSIPEMSRPMLYSMAQSEDDARVLLPMLHSNILRDNEVSTSPADSSSNFMGLLPALLMMNSNKNSNESKDDNSFLPLMLASMSSTGQDQTSAGSLSPLLLAMLGSQGGDTDSILPMALLAMSQRTRTSYTNRSREQQQTWSASHPSNPNAAGESPSTPAYQSPKNGLLMAMLMSSIMGDESNEGDKLKDFVPLILSQAQGPNGPMSSQLGVVLSALLSSGGDSLDKGMMMQLLSNPEISKNPQLMALLLSNAGGDSKNSLSPMMMYALSQPGGEEPNSGIDIMSMLLPMLLNDKDSNNSSNSIGDMLPFLLQSMQQNNPSSQSQILSMALANPSIVSGNPGLIASLLNQPSMTANSPMSFGSNTPSSSLPLPALMSLMSGKPLDLMTLLSMSGSGLQNPGNMGQGMQPFDAQSLGSSNTFGSPAFSSLGLPAPSQSLSNPNLSPAVQSVLESQGSSTDKTLISLIMKSLGRQANSPGIQSIGQTFSPGLSQSALNFANSGLHQPISQLQQSFDSQPGFAHQPFMQQPNFNSPPEISPFKPFASQAGNQFQSLPVNLFSISNFGQSSNGFPTAILSGRDSEHSSNQVSYELDSSTTMQLKMSPQILQGGDECSFPPQAEKKACEFEASQAMTEANCLANRCCWNELDELRCYQTVSQT